MTQPSFSDFDVQSSIFRDLIERWAGAKGDADFAQFPTTGETWTWNDARRHMYRASSALQALGVAKGSVVAVQTLNTPELFEALLGTTALGGLYSPLNPAFRGALLEHALKTSGAGVLICDAGSASHLAGCDAPETLQRIVLTEDVDDGLLRFLGTRFVISSWAELLLHSDCAAPQVPLHFWDPYGIIFTSGTTGPSKGSINCYAQLFATIKDSMLPWAEDDDVYQLDLPMFHVSGLMTFMAALTSGAQLVVFPRVSIESYWQRVIRHGVTHVTMLPAIISFLWNRAPSEDDHGHVLRRINIGRYPANYQDWSNRFAIPHVYVFYNMTELSSPLVSQLDPPLSIGAGRCRPGVSVRLVDENDIEVDSGQVGELIVRTDLPWRLFSGYINDPSATAAAWRNGWFHSGDLFKCDPDGNYHLVDRLKDSIRRRGENVSSFEVEREIQRHEAVAECAVTGIASEHGDDEIVVWIVMKEGAKPDPKAIITFVTPRLPHFMVPRYVQFVDELPRTSSQRVHKAALRALGLGPGAWDRQNLAPDR